MITRKFMEPRGLASNTATYTFVARVEGEGKDLFKAAQARLRDQLGDVPSNSILMLELLRAYAAG